MEGFAKYNPSILKMTHIEAFDAVVNELMLRMLMFCLLIMLVSLSCVVMMIMRMNLS
jgi:hypothetical protein